MERHQEAATKTNTMGGIASNDIFKQSELKVG